MESTDYLRGLVGARLANKDNWVVIIVGSKEFLSFIASRPMPTGGGELIIRPHPLVAGDVKGHPVLWVMVGAQLKATDPVEARHERKAMMKVFRSLGHRGRLRPDQDIVFSFNQGHHSGQGGWSRTTWSSFAPGGKQ